MLINGNCLEEMKNIPDNSVDLIFCDLPYGQTSCKWDCCIDLNLFWKEIMRIKILNAPIIMTTTTKFGVSLIQSAPKKCPFRYDLIWCKSAPCGFLSAKKMPMRKHEMIYVFYEKLPFYDLSSHKHKFIKDNVEELDEKYKNKGGLYSKVSRNGLLKAEPHYDPPLPTSLVKEDIYTISDNTIYGNNIKTINPKERKKGESRYNPPLPTSLIKENNNHIKDGQIYNGGKGMNLISDGKGAQYNPPLPTSLIKEEPPELNLDECNNCKYDVNKNTYGGGKDGRIKISKDKKDHQQKYDPPLPTSLVKENEGSNAYGNNTTYNYKDAKKGESIYDPPLPNSLLEIKSTRGKHSTEKPVQLMEWVLKYYSKEGDTVLDPTMGSGSTGVACKNMNRKFIGIEMDKDIYDGAVKRLE